MIVVADSGPLINLSRIHRLDMLRQLYGSLLVPEPVYREVVITGKGRPGSTEVEALVGAKGAIATGPRFLALGSDLPQLGSGEVSAIACALDVAADLVLMDDRAARAAAEIRGLKVKGTLGVLLEGKARGFMPSVSNAVSELLQRGAWLDASLVREALRLAGEI